MTGRAEPASTPSPAEPPARPRPRLQSLVLSLVPLVIFWVVESYAPLHVALLIAMAFGVGESLYSYWRHGAVDRLTLISTALVLVTGGLSLIFHSGILFKLKPAIFELLFAGMLLGSYALGRPMLLAMARQQMGEIPHARAGYFGGVTLRMGINFVIHAAITVYAAIWLSTGAWIFVKGVISYGMLGLQVAGEILYIRFILRPRWFAEETARAGSAREPGGARLAPTAARPRTAPSERPSEATRG